MGSYTDWLRTRDDDQLTRLLARRPYLASPAPSSFVALAGRATSRSATQRALAEVNALGLQVLRAALVLGRGTPAQVTEAVLGPDPGDDDPARVAAAIADLVVVALAWHDDEALRTAPCVAALLDPDSQHPGRTGQPGHAPSDGRLFRAVARPPRPAPTTVPAQTVAAESVRAAESLVTAVERLVDAWSAAPPPVLRRGGLGMRDLRRTAQALGTTGADAAFVVELAAAASLVVTDPTGPTTAFVPTTAADTWAAAPLPDRWATLARAWVTSPRTTWLVGTKDDHDTVRTAGHPDGWRPWLPRLRRAVLTVLDDARVSTEPDGTEPDARPDDAEPDDARPDCGRASNLSRASRGALTADQVHDVLAWRTPLAVPPLDVVVPLLAEAARLGVTGAGALSLAGRALLTDGDPAAALAADLPPQVDEVWLQADLTGVVPGRPSDRLARLLRSAARQESSGGALTVRFTPGSVAAAVASTGADHVLAELTEVSRGPVPQGLEYLVRDAGRRHDALSAETPDDQAADLAPPRRARPRPSTWFHEPTLADVQAAVAQLRTDRSQPAPSDPAPPAPGPPVRTGDPLPDPLDTLMVLREAVDRRTEAWVDLVDDTGRTTRHRLRPLAVDGGRLRAVDPARAVEITVAVHRIAAAAPVPVEL